MGEQDRTADILLTQRFVPEPGGSVQWMHQVYRRWPRPVRVITHDYYGHPPRTPEFPGAPARPPGGDHVTDANLVVERHDILMRDWGLQSAANVRRYLRMTAAVRRHLGGARRVVVHCTHVLPEVLSLVPLRWRRGDRLRVVCYAHGEEITACRSSRQLHLMMRGAYRIVDRLLVNSRYTADLAAEYVDRARIRIVHPGVEVASFAGSEPAGAAWRRREGYEDRLIVLTVGRLDPRKNHAAVVCAVGRLVKQFPCLLYVVAGEGRQLPALRDQTVRLGLADHVRFAGSVDGALKTALFGACDLFAMPAIRDGTDVEGFGIVFLEAGACGKPVVAGIEGGQRDAVDDGRSGLCVDGTDVDRVAEALRHLLVDPALRRQLGEGGRAKAADHDWAKVVQRTLDVVEELP